MSRRVEPHGALVVDKPVGPTSHDLVARARRTLGTRRVGHAGTLDPLASGVLVLLFGEATKLAPYATSDDKRYRATIRFGVATDTLDAAGATVGEADVPAWLTGELTAIAAGLPLPERIAAAVERERARTAQVPPAYSAIKVAGRRSYDRARRGDAVALDERPVAVRELRVAGADPNESSLDAELSVSKGFYVRSFARDLGGALDVPAHLAALRRLASGAFRLEDSISLEEPPEVLRRALLPTAEAAGRVLPRAVLNDAGVAKARVGKALHASDFDEPPPASPAPAAWLSASGELVAVGKRLPDGITHRVERGFSGPPSD